MHLSHPPPPPPHGAELTMTPQPEALARRSEDVPAVAVLGWNVLNPVLNPHGAALPAPAILMEFCSSPWPSQKPLGAVHPPSFRNPAWIHPPPPSPPKPSRAGNFEPNLIHFSSKRFLGSFPWALPARGEDFSFTSTSHLAEQGLPGFQSTFPSLSCGF